MARVGDYKALGSSIFAGPEVVYKYNAQFETDIDRRLRLLYSRMELCIYKQVACLVSEWKKPVRLTLCCEWWECFAPCEAFGEWALKDAIEGCLEGTRTLALEPRLSCACKSLFSLNSETFISLALGVLKIVRFSRQRALQFRAIAPRENRSQDLICSECFRARASAFSLHSILYAVKLWRATRE